LIGIEITIIKKENEETNRTENEIRRHFQKEQEFLDKFILGYNYNSNDHPLSDQP